METPGPEENVLQTATSHGFMAGGEAGVSRGQNCLQYRRPIFEPDRERRMQFVSFRHGGRARYGVVKDGGVIDATDRLADRFTNLRDVIAGEALLELAPMADHGEPDVGLDDIEYLFPVTAPSKIFCIGRNYRAYHEVLEDGGEPEYLISPLFVCPTAAMTLTDHEGREA